MEETHILMYKSFEHDLWLVTKREYLKVSINSARDKARRDKAESRLLELDPRDIGCSNS